MNSKLRLDKSLLLWKSELVREDVDSIQDYVLSWAILGPKAYRKGGNTTPVIREINRANKFESSLVELCKAFKFNVSDPKYKPMPTPNGVPNSVLPSKLDSGQLYENVGNHLVILFLENRNYISRLREKLEKINSANQIEKPGQMKTPSFYAYHICIGLDLFKGSENHIKKLREYIEPGSEFEKWIKYKIKIAGLEAKEKKTILGLFIQEKSSQALMGWRSSKRQSMVSALFEDRSKKATEPRGTDEEKNKIESEIASRVKEFNERLNRQNNRRL